MLNGCPRVRISLNADAGYQLDRVPGGFRKPVRAISRKINNRTHH